MEAGNMYSTLKRTWAEIDLDALAHNYITLRKRIGDDVYRTKLSY